MGISLLHRKESIIISTIETLNEVGLQKLSTKLIAQREGVSEGTLFRHFKNKTEIMLAVIEHFSQFDNAIIETSINKKLNPIERIRYFVKAYAEYYENYPEITAVVQAYDSLMSDPELAVKVQIIIEKRTSFIVETIKEAQNANMIQRNIDSEILGDLILGGFKEICFKWRILGYTFSIKDKTLLMFDMISSAFSKQSGR